MIKEEKLTEKKKNRENDVQYKENHYENYKERVYL